MSHTHPITFLLLHLLFHPPPRFLFFIFTFFHLLFLFIILWSLDQTLEFSLLKKFLKEQPCHKLAQSTGLLLSPNPRQRGLEHHLIFVDFYPCSLQLHQKLHGPCGRIFQAQNPVTSVKIPTSLQRSECTRLVWWEPLRLWGQQNVYQQGLPARAQTTLPRSPLRHPCLARRQDLPNCLSLLVSDSCLPKTS